MSFKRVMVVAAATLTVAGRAEAQVKVLFENDTARVYTATFKVGFVSPMHTHALPHTNYVLSGGKVRVRRQDGSTRELDLKTGDVFWGSVETHVAENIGATEVVILTTEIKAGPAHATPSATPRPPR